MLTAGRPITSDFFAIAAEGFVMSAAVIQVAYKLVAMSGSFHRARLSYKSLDPVG